MTIKLFVSCFDLLPTLPVEATPKIVWTINNTVVVLDVVSLDMLKEDLLIQIGFGAVLYIAQNSSICNSEFRFNVTAALRPF